MGILDADRGQPGNISDTTFLLDSFRKKALVGQINFHTDLTLTDTSKILAGQCILLPHFGRKGGEEIGGNNAGSLVLLQVLQLVAVRLGGHVGGGIGCIAMILGCSEAKSTHTHRNLGLVPAQIRNRAS